MYEEITAKIQEIRNAAGDTALAIVAAAIATTFRRLKTCANCREKYLPKTKRKGRGFCGDECRKEFHGARGRRR